MIEKPAFFGRVRILVKPNAKKDELLGFDEEKQAYKVAIAAPPEDNKANIAVIKFFTRLTKKKVAIIAGLASKQKILHIKEPSEKAG
jgi:uncharacterized protein (TIGR00251 family)